MPEPRAFYSPFDGDGRMKVFPTNDIRRMRPEAHPIGVTRSTARLMIDHFVKEGYSIHSPLGSTVWVIEVWAYTQGVEIKVIKHPVGGWMIKLLGQEEEEVPEPEAAQARFVDYGY